jgi:hypothetical protein
MIRNWFDILEDRREPVETYLEEFPAHQIEITRTNSMGVMCLFVDSKGIVHHKGPRLFRGRGFTLEAHTGRSAPLGRIQTRIGVAVFNPHALGRLIIDS